MLRVDLVETIVVRAISFRILFWSSYVHQDDWILQKRQFNGLERLFRVFSSFIEKIFIDLQGIEEPSILEVIRDEQFESIVLFWWIFIVSGLSYHLPAHQSLEIFSGTYSATFRVPHLRACEHVGELCSHRNSYESLQLLGIKKSLHDWINSVGFTCSALSKKVKNCAFGATSSMLKQIKNVKLIIWVE